MMDLIKKILFAGMGLASMTKQKAEAIVKPLVKKGEFSEKEGRKFSSELLKKSQGARKGLEKMIDGLVKRTLSKMNIPTKDDYLNLSQRIEKLEKKSKAKPKKAVSKVI